MKGGVKPPPCLHLSSHRESDRRKENSSTKEYEQQSDEKPLQGSGVSTLQRQDTARLMPTKKVKWISAKGLWDAGTDTLKQQRG